MPKDKMLDIMVQAAREAGDEARRIQDSGSFEIINKGGVVGTHFLTRADTASEEIILGRLGDAFPDIPIVAEEKVNAQEIPPDALLVDGIDGTPCFIHGGDEWGVMITKLKDHLPEVAVIYIPGRDFLALAERGKGCFLNDKQVTLGNWPDNIRDKTLIGIELGPWWAKDNLPSTVLGPLMKKFGIRSLLSGAYGTIGLLRGETHAWINLISGWPWDFGPGWLFMKEAGGWVSGADGGDLEFKRLVHMDAVYAVNEEMAQKILSLTTAWSKSRSV